MVPGAAFDLVLDHGRCVGVRLPAADGEIHDLAARALLPAERAFAAELAPARRRTWIGGRVALRWAFAQLAIEAPPVVADDRGAPVVPAGVVASISHKAEIAVALVALVEASPVRVGVDIELDDRRGLDIATKVLTDDELSEIAGLDEGARRREVLLRFSAKEAIYKAIDPFVRRYVGFKEVRVTPRPDGTADVGAFLRPEEGPMSIEVRWLRIDGYVLTTSRAWPAAPTSP
jgi:enterobactin synthetase component D